jgi:hypothetical protein
MTDSRSRFHPQAIVTSHETISPEPKRMVWKVHLPMPARQGLEGTTRQGPDGMRQQGPLADFVETWKDSGVQHF